VVRIIETRKDIDRIVEKVEGPGKDKKELSEAERELLESAKELKTALTAMEKRFWRPPDTKGYPAETDAMSKLNELFRGGEGLLAAGRGTGGRRSGRLQPAVC
jgi:hypothetical protein